MSVEVKETPRGVEVMVQTATREQLFRESIAATLELLPGPRSSDLDPMGRVWPIQVSGEDDHILLFNMIGAVVLAAAQSPQRLLPPRWTAFDEGRATATLLVSADAAPAVDFDVAEVADCSVGAAESHARIGFVRP